MDAQLEIRRAQPGDRDAVLGMWLRLIEHHRRLDPDYPIPGGLRLGLRGEIDRGLLQGRCGIWLAQAGAALAGFCFAESEERSGPEDAGAAGWIHELWVEPDWRRRGVAAALVRPALEFLARNASRISVRVEAANSEALGFWNNLGFRARAHVLERDARELGSDDGNGTAR